MGSASRVSSWLASRRSSQCSSWHGSPVAAATDLGRESHWRWSEGFCWTKQGAVRQQPARVGLDAPLYSRRPCLAASWGCGRIGRIGRIGRSLLERDEADKAAPAQRPDGDSNPNVFRTFHGRFPGIFDLPFRQQLPCILLPPIRRIPATTCQDPHSAANRGSGITSSRVPL